MNLKTLKRRLQVGETEESVKQLIQDTVGKIMWGVEVMYLDFTSFNICM